MKELLDRGAGMGRTLFLKSARRRPKSRFVNIEKSARLRRLGEERRGGTAFEKTVSQDSFHLRSQETQLKLIQQNKKYIGSSNRKFGYSWVFQLILYKHY